MNSQIDYVKDEELDRQRCPCGGKHRRKDYQQLPCRWNGAIVERFYRCPQGEIVSWCKRGPAGVSFGKL